MIYSVQIHIQCHAPYKCNNTLFRFFGRVTWQLKSYLKLTLPSKKLERLKVSLTEECIISKLFALNHSDQRNTILYQPLLIWTLQNFATKSQNHHHHLSSSVVSSEIHAMWEDWHTHGQLYRQIFLLVQQFLWNYSCLINYIASSYKASVWCCSVFLFTLRWFRKSRWSFKPHIFLLFYKFQWHWLLFCFWGLKPLILSSVDSISGLSAILSECVYVCDIPPRGALGGVVAKEWKVSVYYLWLIVICLYK